MMLALKGIFGKICNFIFFAKLYRFKNIINGELFMTKTELKNIIKEALREDYFFYNDYENSNEPVRDAVPEEPSRVSCNWVPV